MKTVKSTPIVAIANHKGGTGKTTTTVNVAAELARLILKKSSVETKKGRNLAVLVVDLDPQANASLHIGKKHPSDIPITTAELLLSEADKLPLSIHEETNLDGVSLIYGSLALGRAEDKLKDETPRPSEELRRKLEPLIGIYDIILIDCPPSLKLLTSNALAAATHLLIPVESGSQYGLYGVSDLLKHVEKIRQVNPHLELLGALLVRHDERQTVCKLIESAAKDLVGKLVPIKISTSTKINQAAATQVSVHSIDRGSKVAREYRKLAEYVAEQCGIQVEKFDSEIAS